MNKMLEIGYRIGLAAESKNADHFALQIG